MGIYLGALPKGRVSEKGQAPIITVIVVESGRGDVRERLPTSVGEGLGLIVFGV